MKRVENPRRDINVPDVAEYQLAGLGSVRRLAPATLLVEPGPPAPGDGPLAEEPAPGGAVQPRIFATPEVCVELGAVQQLARLARLDQLVQAQAEALHAAGQRELAERYRRIR